MEKHIQRYPMIDVMKFFMAIMVIALHANPLSDYSFWGNYMITQCLTRVAVPFFFIAAGFFLFRKMTLESLDGAAVRSYVIRILRLYCIWCLIYLPLIIYSVIMNPKGIFLGILSKLRLFFVFGPYFHLWFLPAWALAVAAFYFLLKRCSIRTILLVSVFLYLIPLLGSAYYGVFEHFCPPDTVGYSIVHFFQIVFYVPVNGLTYGLFFVSVGGGIALCRWTISFNKVISLVLTTFLCMIFESFFLEYTGIALGGGVYVFLLPLSVGIFFLIKDFKIKEGQYTFLLRKMSMFVYFIHPYFLFFTEGMDSLARFSLTASLSVLGAYVIVRLSEHYYRLRILC